VRTFRAREEATEHSSPESESPNLALKEAAKMIGWQKTAGKATPAG
jgi:hypothetical protein